MVNVLIGAVVSLWMYKLIKIVKNSMELNSFSKECRELAKNKGASRSAKFALGAERYQKAQKKILFSKLLWFSIEVTCFVALYMVFLK